MKLKKILVTGEASFLERHFYGKLLDDGLRKTIEYFEQTLKG